MSTHRLGFLKSGRWIALAGILAVVCVTCVFLGRWQWHRHIARDAANALVTQNYERAPVPLETVLASPNASLAPGDQWRQVVVQGQYSSKEQRLLRGRVVDGDVVYQQLVPFTISSAGSLSGQVLIINRGWLPAPDDARAPVRAPAVPSGQVSVVVHLRPLEQPSGRQAPTGQVYTIDANSAGLPGFHPLDAYGQLVSENGGSLTNPAPLPRPETDPGPHLPYAFQWWIFAAGAVLTYILLARRAAADLAGVVRPPRARTKPGSDEHEEDLVIARQTPS